MASPAADQQPNGISTPPTTVNAANLSPPTSTQPNTQQASQMNGNSFTSTPGVAVAANPSFPQTSLQDTGISKRPRDARLIHLILANMGVHAYTERVPLQLLDFAYRYTNGILSDALAYEPPAPSHSSSSKKAAAKQHADDGTDGAGGVTLNALRTAIAARAANQFSAVLPKEFMGEVAAERNRVALPRVERQWGVRLPPERYCFTGVGWGVGERWEEEEDVDALDDVGGMMDVGGPVGGLAAGLPVDDTEMGGMEVDEDDLDEFEDVMGIEGNGEDVNMRDG